MFLKAAALLNRISTTYAFGIASALMLGGMGLVYVSPWVGLVVYLSSTPFVALTMKRVIGW